MQYEDLRKFLTTELESMKSNGFRIFINTEDQFKQHNYGLVTDGTNILYVQCCEHEALLEPMLKYVKTKENGCGCPAIEEGFGYQHLTPEAFQEAVDYGKKLATKYKATLYKSFDEYIKKEPHDLELYIEL